MHIGVIELLIRNFYGSLFSLETIFQVICGFFSRRQVTDIENVSEWHKNS